MYAPTAERSAINTDAYAASAGAWRIATAGTPWFDGMDVTDIHGTHGTTDGGNLDGQWLSESPNGHVTAQRTMGAILAGVPAYWILPTGTSEQDFSLAPGALTAAMLSALVVTLLFLAVRPRAGTPLALAGALVFALGTPTWAVSANGLWTHPITQLGIAGAAYASSRSRWWLAGAFLAIGMLGRPHVALIAAVLGLGVAWSRRSVRPALAIGVPALGALGALAVWSHLVHGYWSIGGAYQGAVDRAVQGADEMLGFNLSANYLGFLISPDRGFLVWTPLVVLFVPAVVRGWRALPPWSLWLVGGGFLYSFVQIRLNYFAGGAGFYGYRHGLELLTCLAPMLIFAAPKLGSIARRLVPVIAAVQIAAFTLGATVEGLFVPLEDVWHDNSFWLALRYNPGAVGAWLAFAVLLGAFVSLRYVPSPSPREASAADEEHAFGRLRETVKIRTDVTSHA